MTRRNETMIMVITAIIPLCDDMSHRNTSITRRNPCDDKLTAKNNMGPVHVEEGYQAGNQTKWRHEAKTRKFIEKHEVLLTLHLLQWNTATY